MADKQSRGVINHTVVDGEPDISYLGSRKSPSSLTVKIDVDVLDAVSGLKAVQREAREATKALRELESTQKLTMYEATDALPIPKFTDEPDLSEVTTSRLQRELSRREGVKSRLLGDGEFGSMSAIGPARILVYEE